MEDDQHQEEISGEPSKQEGFPSGTEEPNSNEDLTIFTPERKPCSEYNSSPTKLQCGPCNQMCSPKSDLEAHMNGQGHLRFIQESAEEEENARYRASLSANFRSRKLIQETDKDRQEQKHHRKASDIQSRLSQASDSQDDLQGDPGQSRRGPRLSRDGNIVRKTIDFMSEPASGTSQHDQRDYDIADFDRYTEEEDDFYELKSQGAVEIIKRELCEGKRDKMRPVVDLAQEYRELCERK